MKNNGVYDVIIMGGGIGGVHAAAILAKHDLRVLLVEAEVHPRFTIGEATTPDTNFRLKLLGVKYDVPEIVHLSAFHTTRDYVSPASGVKRAFSFLYQREGIEQNPQESHQYPTLAPPMGPDCHFFRQDTDAYMLAIAMTYGADVRQQTRVAQIDIADELVTLGTAKGEVFTGRYLVDATGMKSVLAIQNLDREHAFSPSDQQLLATIAGSLGVALENAQLIHETRQRVAELGTVNSVGQALATQLDLDALINLVGERVRETFDADIAYVALHDEAAGVIEFPYNWELGEHVIEPPMPFGEGLTSQIIESGEPLLHNAAAADDRPVVGTPCEVLPRRPDLGRRPRDRRDQRPEHARGRALRRGRHPPARDARRKRGRGDPERAPLRRDRAARRSTSSRSSGSARSP